MGDVIAVLLLFCLGIAVGAFIGPPLTAGSPNGCRAANPGYDCKIGWVPSDPWAAKE